MTRVRSDTLVKEVRADSRKESLAALQLLKHLGNLPLAIEQAGAYIHTSSMDISTYLQTYTKNAKGLLESVPAIWNYRNETVLTTWENSFAAIQKRDPDAAYILLLSGFLDRNDLWMGGFQSGLRVRWNGANVNAVKHTALADQ